MSTESQREEALLSPYRVLDMTEGGYMVGGKILGDLGADVIKIEPPGGSPSRNIGPFYKDIYNPERSLFWFAYNTNKRGITLDTAKADGQDSFKRLVETADIVMESFEPGYLDSLGLGYQSLSEIKPEIILTSITPFGQSGPYAHYKATDIVTMAMGGSMYLCGDPTRAPLRVGYPQAQLHGGAEGAAASMIALWHRLMSGEGQHVDVSTQLCIIQTLMNATAFPHLHKEDLVRRGDRMKAGFTAVRPIFPTKDGYISFMPVAGYVGTASMRAMVDWMKEEGMAPDWMKEKDWESWDILQVALSLDGQKELDAQEEAFVKFFPTHTTQETYEEALKRRILIAPCSTIEHIVANPQLIDRGYFAEVEHPELGATLTYPAVWGKLAETPIGIRRRAPLIGEHNEEIYEKELGMPKDRLILLKQAGVI